MKTVSITSKGQITIPAEIQRQLGLKASDKLKVEIDSLGRTITLQKPLPIDEVAAKLHALPRKKIKPIINTREFYERERTKEIVERMEENL